MPTQIETKRERSLLDVAFQTKDRDEEMLDAKSICPECEGACEDQGDPYVGYKGSVCETCQGAGVAKRDWLQEGLEAALTPVYFRPRVEVEHLRAVVIHAVEIIRSQREELERLRKPVQSEGSARKPAAKEVA